MRFALVIVGALMALSLVEAHGFEHLKAKLRNRFDIGGSNTYGAAGAAGYGGHGNGGAGAAASAAATAGSRGGRYGGSSSAAAAASADTSGYGAAPYGGGYQAPAYAEYEPYVRAAPVRPRFSSYAPEYAGARTAAASAAAVSSAGLGVPPPPPARPVVDTGAYRSGNVALHYAPPVAPPVVNRFNIRRPAAHHGVAGGAAAAAAASVAAGGLAGISGVSSAASAATAGNGLVGGGAASQVLASSSGTYSNNDNGRESSSYKRSTENVQNHEDGNVNDNHYYNAQSYGKAQDEDLHEAFNKNDEDIEQTPTVYRSKKSGENYVMDFKKAHRETGSGVLAKDKHSSAFNKNTKKFTENVDQAQSREGNGFFEDQNRVSTQVLDDEDEEVYDSDGFAHPTPVLGARGGAAAASAAAGGASGLGGVSSSAAAATAAARGI